MHDSTTRDEGKELHLLFEKAAEINAFNLVTVTVSERNMHSQRDGHARNATQNNVLPRTFGTLVILQHSMFFGRCFG